MHEKKVDIYIATKGGVRAKEGRYGWIVEYITATGEPRTREGFGAEKNTTSQRMTLAAIKGALAILREPVRVTLHIPDPFVKSAFIRKSIIEWGEHGCNTAAGVPIKNAQLWQDIYELQVGHIIEIAEDGPYNPYTIWLKGQM